MDEVRQGNRAGPKRPANVSLSESLLDEARRLGINVSQACERGLAESVRAEKARQWHDRNAIGFAAWDAYVERNGVPLAQYRKF